MFETITLFLVLFAVYAYRRARTDGRRKRLTCAACRGDRDGQVTLLPDDAPLCGPHYQRQCRIRRLEWLLLTPR